MTPISLTLLYLCQTLEGFNFPMNIAEPEPVDFNIPMNIAEPEPVDFNIPMNIAEPEPLPQGIVCNQCLSKY